MYVILPGKMGYTESYHFISAARRMLEEAKELLNDASFGVAVEADELTSEQLEAYDHYVKTAEKLLWFYIDNSDEPLTEEYGDIFALFAFTLAHDSVFHGMVEDYFRAINEVFNDLIKSSKERNIRVRGVDRLLYEYTYASATIQKLTEIAPSNSFAVVDLMSDLFVD